MLGDSKTYPMFRSPFATGGTQLVNAQSVVNELTGTSNKARNESNQTLQGILAHLQHDEELEEREADS